MLHYDGNSWVDITTAVDTANNTVTGLTTTLSPFVLAIPTTCCIPPMRGNVDYDSGDAIDISDLVYLVDYMFTGGPAPTCWAETNIDGSGPIGIEDGSADIDISDLVYLVDYMFTGGPAPLPCP